MQRIIYLFLLTLLAVACDEDSTTLRDEEEHALEIAVSSQPWEDETIMLTRAGEMIDPNTGFALFSEDFKLTNVQVKWDENKWTYPELIWPIKQPTNPEEEPKWNLDLYAYAPYEETNHVSDNNYYTFKCCKDNTTDLLWAEVKRDDYTVKLKFNHALAKLSFGTITNNTTHKITLESLKVSGELFGEGILNITNGNWSTQDEKSAEATTTYPKTVVVEPGKKETFGSENEYILQIPGQAVTLTVVLNIENYGTCTIKKSGILLEQGKNKIINITVATNFEVVIK